MKITIRLIFLIFVLISSIKANITISGAIGPNFKTSDENTNIPVGSLFLVIVDTSDNGFLNFSTSGAITPSIVGLSNDPGVTLSNASITSGGLFGGETILATGANTSVGVLPSMLTNVSIAGFESKNFALIWFEKSAATLTTEGLAGQSYGIIRGADWILPSDDLGLFTMSPDDSNGAYSYFSFSSNSITANQTGPLSGFFTGTGTAGDGSADIKAATFQIGVAAIPEPSSALLGSLGLMALFRRRRSA